MTELRDESQQVFPKDAMDAEAPERFLASINKWRNFDSQNVDKWFKSNLPIAASVFLDFRSKM